MFSLFNVKFNWGAYFLILIFIKIFWLDLSFWGFIAIAITLHQFLLLFFSLGSVMPIRYLLGSFMCLQMLLGSALAYNGLDAFQTNQLYQMQIPEAAYYAYILPAVLLFISGLHITAAKSTGAVLNTKEIAYFVDH